LRGAGFMLAGTALLAFVWLGAQAKTEFAHDARRAEGIVVALQAGPAHPKIEFADTNGNKVAFFAGGWISHRVGDRVQVLFLEDAPLATAQLDEPGSRWFLLTIVGTLGGGMLIGGSLILARRRR